MNKYLKALMGRVYRDSAAEGASGGGSIDSAASAFSSFLGGEAPAENEAPKNDDPEAAAERLAAEEAAAANQNSAEEGQQQPNQGDQGADNDTVTFEVDGKPVSMTKAELAELHKSGLRQKDYTQKTMEVAEARKTAEQEAQRAKAERDSYAQKLNAFALTQESIIADGSKILTKELLDRDPVEYLSQQRILQERQANLAAAQQELQRIGMEQQQEAQQEQQNFLKRQYETLVEKLPEWKDPAKQKADFQAIESFMEERGFAANDGRMILDARVILMARDAMKYRDLLSRAAKASEKVNAAPPKVERPGVAATNVKPDGRTVAMQNLKKSGSVDAAAEAFKQFL